MKATAIANANIALIKYWGRKENNHPYNSSLSVTMDSQLATKTTVEFSENYKRDEFFLNNEQKEDKMLEKVSEHLNNVRRKAGIHMSAKVVSMNSFPHSAGLASSASGFCALTGAASKALGMDLTLVELSKLCAQSPSGSSVRSVYGGFVEYDDDKNCAVELFPENYWLNLRNVIAIVDTDEKKVNSCDGMGMTIETSSLFDARIESAFNHLLEVKEALREKDTDKLFTSIMKESNNLHAVMLDTWPPLFYLNKTSKEIIYAIHDLNKEKMIAGYTFDAGPNAHIFTTENHVKSVTEKLSQIKNIQKIIICKPGKGLRYTNQHLF